MTQLDAFKGFYIGHLALVLGGGTLVYVADPLNKVFVIEQHGAVIDEGRITPLQAKRFTDAATGARELERTVVNLNSLIHVASA